MWRALDRQWAVLVEAFGTPDSRPRRAVIGWLECLTTSGWMQCHSLAASLCCCHAWPGHTAPAPPQPHLHTSPPPPSVLPRHLSGQRQRVLAGGQRHARRLRRRAAGEPLSHLPHCRCTVTSLVGSQCLPAPRLYACFRIRLSTCLLSPGLTTSSDCRGRPTSPVLPTG